MRIGIQIKVGKPPLSAEAGPEFDLLVGRDGLKEMLIIRCVGIEKQGLGKQGVETPQGISHQHFKLKPNSVTSHRGSPTAIRVLCSLSGMTMGSVRESKPESSL